MASILFINQYFPPDQAATGQLLGQLAADTSKAMNVTVICGTPTYSPEKVFTQNEKISLHRIPLLPVSRRNILVRLLNYFLFLFGAIFKSLSLGRQDVVVCWTDPPVIGLCGVILRWVHGSKFVFVSQDVYPEVAIAAGKMNNVVSVFILSLISKSILKSADRVISVGEDMDGILFRKGCLRDKIVTIPNWQDLEHLSPRSPDVFRERHDISKDTLIVMHSGNMGFSQDFETLLGCAELLKGEKKILFLLVGDGAREAGLKKMVERQNLTNVQFLPYQPGKDLAASLSAGDIHYVSLKKSFLGVVVPSKLYGILAVGRPVLAVVPKNSQVEKVVLESDCGWLCDASPKSLADQLLTILRDPDDLKKKGENGRRWVEIYGNRSKAIQSYLEVFNSLYICEQLTY